MVDRSDVGDEPGNHGIACGNLGDRRLQRAFATPATAASMACHQRHETRVVCHERRCMTSTLRLGRVAGIDIGAHWSWLLVFGLIVWSLAAGYDTGVARSRFRPRSVQISV